MKIYFSASISGGRKYLDTYKLIVKYLKSQGHDVLSEHIVLDNLLELERKLTPVSVYARDIQCLNECDAVIAEVTNPSLGVGYEICWALIAEKPTLCLFQKNTFVSWMIIGNNSPFLNLGEYDNTTELSIMVDNFLALS